MSENIIIFLTAQAIVVVGSIVTAAYHFGSKLSKIETSITFIQKNCPKCKEG